MKLIRNGWPIYVACSTAILVMLGWMTTRFLTMERAERSTASLQEYQDDVRLALWRIDSWLGPLLALEASRPYSDYLSVTTDSEQAESLRFFLVRFQVDTTDELSSPEVSNPSATDSERREARQHLARVSKLLGETELEACLRESERMQQLLEERLPSTEPAIKFAGSRPDYELSKRQGAAKTLAQAQNQTANMLSAQSTAREVRLGAFLPLWFPMENEEPPELLFVRRVIVDGAQQFQGFLCSWPALHEEMVNQIRDLLPLAEINPLTTTERSGPDAVLATLPATIVSPLPVAEGTSWKSPTHVVLALSWLGVITGLLAVAFTFRSTVALAEKKTRFAAAVTHELRTPLTTFRMYTDMLSQGMVQDDEQRDEYILTLRDESERLARLVENVLAYSQMEEGRRRSQLETVTLGELLERLSPPLRSRAESAGLSIEIKAGPCENHRVRTDVDAIGHILFNLVDNACKYAGDNQGLPLIVQCRDQGESVSLVVTDHGKGIASGQTAMVFSPFERGPDTVDRPGIGLGLALARGLAREIGGELQLLSGGDGGASFELTLPKS